MLASLPYHSAYQGEDGRVNLDINARIDQLHTTTPVKLRAETYHADVRCSVHPQFGVHNPAVLLRHHRCRTHGMVHAPAPASDVFLERFVCTVVLNGGSDPPHDVLSHGARLVHSTGELEDCEQHLEV